LWSSDALEFGTAVCKAIAPPGIMGVPTASPKPSVSFVDQALAAVPIPAVPPSVPSPVQLNTQPLSSPGPTLTTNHSAQHDHPTPDGKGHTDRGTQSHHPPPVVVVAKPAPKVSIWPQGQTTEGPATTPSAAGRAGSVDIEALKRELKEEFAAELARQLTAFKEELLAALLPHLSADPKT